MVTSPGTDSVFIIVSLFLLIVVAIMSVIQLVIWIIAVTTKKTKIELTNKTYETLLDHEDYQGLTIKKAKATIKFANYQTKNNCLKLSKRNFQEKTVWNIYQNLVSIALMKWKKTNRKTNITLIISTIIFYLSAIMGIVLALIFYIATSQNKIDQINTSALSILSFIVLLSLVLSWLVWTMTYEKLRKEVIELANKLDDKNLLKIVKIISGYKTLFPGSELLFN